MASKLLAELHLQGSITHSDFLSYIGNRNIDWTDYEAAYGLVPPIR